MNAGDRFEFAAWEDDDAAEDDFFQDLLYQVKLKCVKA